MIHKMAYPVSAVLPCKVSCTASVPHGGATVRQVSPRSPPPPNSCAASNAKSKLERVRGTHDMKIQPPHPKLGIPDLRTITRTLHLTPFPLLAETVGLLRLMYQFSTILILVFHPFFHQSTEPHVHSIVLPPLRLCQGETQGLIKRC